jgi:hypothetical protein
MHDRPDRSLDPEKNAKAAISLLIRDYSMANEPIGPWDFHLNYNAI